MGLDFSVNIYNYLLFIILIIIVGYYSLKYLFFILIGFCLGVYLTYYYLK
jgi:hypothetical protein